MHVSAMRWLSSMMASIWTKLSEAVIAVMMVPSLEGTCHSAKLEVRVFGLRRRMWYSRARTRRGVQPARAEWVHWVRAWLLLFSSAPRARSTEHPFSAEGKLLQRNQQCRERSKVWAQS